MICVSINSWLVYDESVLTIFMEMADESLDSYLLREHRKTAKWDDAVKSPNVKDYMATGQFAAMAMQVLRGLDYLHAKQPPIIHRESIVVVVIIIIMDNKQQEQEEDQYDKGQLDDYTSRPRSGRCLMNGMLRALTPCVCVCDYLVHVYAPASAAAAAAAAAAASTTSNI
jgi:hypothetical protein